ncbi:MAG: hypothetical protein J1G04_01935 [Clostridiales bacterium]|nr:hypothetical protein [Clostridiales bacterium]
MKKRINALSMACILGVVFCCGTLGGCKSGSNGPVVPEEDPDITIDNAFVRIDRATESITVMDGITAVDGNGKDITDKVKVECSDMSLNDGVATFTECGDYTLTYSVEDDYGKKATAEKTVAVRNIYSVYLTNATVPPLYGALDLASNEYPFIFFNDRLTVNVDCYGDRALGKYGGEQADYDNAIQKFLELYNQDSDGYFRLFIPDARNQMLLKTVVWNDISETRYDVKYLSDGSMSYSISFPYRDDDAYQTWQNNVEIYEAMYRLAQNKQPLSYNDVTLGDYFLSYELHNMYIYAASKPNAEFWGAFPEALVSSDERVQAEVNKANLIKKQPDVMYNALTEEQKSKFLQSVSFDKATFDAQYFNKDGNYLIVTGTNPVTGTVTEDQFLEIFTSICNDYPSYNVLFKPHPASIPSESDFDKVYNFMNEHNIKILPGRLPMEVISWTYNDVLLGGFDSSLYMAVPQGNTVFFIAENKDMLTELSRQLYESGVFGDVKFYWIQQ